MRSSENEAFVLGASSFRISRKWEDAEPQEGIETSTEEAAQPEHEIRLQYTEIASLNKWIHTKRERTSGTLPPFLRTPYYPTSTMI